MVGPSLIKIRSFIKYTFFQKYEKSKEYVNNTNRQHKQLTVMSYSEIDDDALPFLNLRSNCDLTNVHKLFNLHFMQGLINHIIPQSVKIVSE